MTPPPVAVVVVSWNSRDDLPDCLASLEKATVALEVVVVDNASTDGSAAVARAACPSARVLEPGHNLGFGAASNLGWRSARAPHVLFLNPDAQLQTGALEALCAVLLARPEVGIVGPATRYADGAPQLSFGRALTPWSEWGQRRLVRGLRTRDPRVVAEVEAMLARAHDPDWVSGSCLLARRTLLEALGGFDEQFFLYEEDVDLCVRARAAGSLVAFTPAARVVHRQGRSMAAASLPSALEYDRSHLAYYRKHHGPAGAFGLRSWLTALGLLGLAASAFGRAGAENRARSRARLRLGLFGRDVVHRAA
jgi:GT2 family glycosyltransferase